MLTNSKMAFSLALVLAIALATTAALKQPGEHCDGKIRVD
jgi:hypothetical protein